MAGGDTEDCFVCRKHRDRGPLVPGGPVVEDELVLVSHVVTPDALGREGATAYLGHLLVEPRRHARFAGTPREYWGIDVDEWPQARRGTAAEIGALVHELRGYLAGHQVG